MTYRLALPALVGVILFWVAPASLAGPVSRSAARRPGWLTAAPEPDGGKLFFIGVKTGGPSLEEGREAALKDAAAQAAFFVMAKLSTKSIYYSSPVASRLYEELRAAPRGAFQGMRIRDLYWERWQSRGGTPGFDVWALVEVPSAQMSAERERLRKADEELAAKLGQLCADIFPILSARPGAKAQVSGFKEAASSSRFPFSRILEESLRGCLIQHGAAVVFAGPAELRVTGDYWEGPGSVTVSAKVFSSHEGLSAGSSQAVLPRDAVEPLWLRGDEDDLTLFSPPPQEEPRAPRAGALAVRSEPAGARIYLDGVDRGLTPSVLGGVKPGARSVVLELRDYVPYSIEANVEPDAKALVAAKLERKTGKLFVRCRPEGAEVRVDGVPKGRSPLGPLVLPTGSYKIALNLKDHKPWSKQVDIVHGGSTVLDPELDEEEGNLFILVEPAGADILVDGVLKGQSAPQRPIRLDKTQSGPRQVSARKAGFIEQSWSVRVRPHRTTSVTGALLMASPALAAPLPLPKPQRHDEDTSQAFAWFKPIHSSPPFWYGWSDWFSRPTSAIYINILGGTVGGNYNNLRVLEGAVYFLDSTLGVGTSLVTANYGNYAVTRTDRSRSYYGPSTLSQQRVNFNMVSIFPLQFYIVPLAHAYRAADHDLMASAQLYANLCFWSFPGINDGIVDSSSSKVPVGSVIDYGLLLHPGAFVGLRLGYVDTRLPSFTYANSSYSSLKDNKFYVAADLSLGLFSPARRTP